MLGTVQMNDAIKNGDNTKIIEYMKINKKIPIPSNAIERATFYNHLDTIKFLHDLGERCNFMEPNVVYSGNICSCLCHTNYNTPKNSSNSKNRQEKISIDQVSMEIREYFDSDEHNKHNCSWGKCLNSIIYTKEI